MFYTVNHLDIYRYVYYTYMFWWSPFFFDEKKKQKKQQQQQTNYGVQTIECSCLLLQSIVYDQMEEKLSNKLPAPILKDFRLENIDCTKYQLIVVTADEILSKTFFSSWK